MKLRLALKDALIAAAVAVADAGVEVSAVLVTDVKPFRLRAARECRRA